MKKALVLLILIVMATVGLTACRPETRFVTIATGGTGGPMNIIGVNIAEILNANVRHIQASATVTTASVVNVQLLQKKEADIAFAMNDVVYYAYSGTEMFQTGKLDNLAGMAALYPNFVQVFVRADSPIQSIADLRGRRVGVGAAGSGSEVSARQILNAHGITYNDIRPDFLSFAEAAEGIRNNTVDAAFLTSGLPNSSLMELATTTAIRFLPIEAGVVTSLAKDFPFYFPIYIPAGTYRGQDAPVATAAVTAILVVRKDLPEDLVFEMTRAIFDNLATLQKSHSAAAMISLDRVRNGMPLPLHPGAERYFRQKGK